MEIASGCGERTHKDKAFIFSQMDRLHQQRTHSEYRPCYQLFAAISRPISANFEWIAPSDCRLRAIKGTGRRAIPYGKPYSLHAKVGLGGKIPEQS
jgi:hypothetical protein